MITIKRRAVGAARLLVGLTVGAALGAGFAAAQTAPETPPAGEQQAELQNYDRSTTIFTYEGGEVTLADLIAERQALAGQFNPNVDVEVLYSAILRRVERRILLSEAAIAAGLDEDPEVLARIEQARREILAQTFLEREAGLPPTEEDLQAFYEEQVAQLPPVMQTRTRHILVETEEAAQAIVAELEGGADFAELASQRSTGPSRARGGDLGFQPPGALVPAYEQAAAALEVGQVSAPVQTRFGWHVIKVEGREERPQAPPLDRVRQPMMQMLVDQRSQALMERVRPQFGFEAPTSRPPYNAILRDDL